MQHCGSRQERRMRSSEPDAKVETGFAPIGALESWVNHRARFKNRAQ